jgi:hypothetical protein
MYPFKVLSRHTLGGTKELPPARIACVAAKSRNDVSLLKIGRLNQLAQSNFR